MVESWMIAAATLIPLLFLKFLFSQFAKGIVGLIIKIIIGIGAAVGAAFVSGFCQPLALFIVIVAIILGEFFGALAVYFSSNIPFIGGKISSAILPIKPFLFIILVLTVILFIIHLLSIFEIIPIIGWILIILNIVIPIVIISLIWKSYVGSIGGISECFGGGPIEVPGTGGIKIGTSS